MAAAPPVSTLVQVGGGEWSRLPTTSATTADSSVLAMDRTRLLTALKAASLLAPHALLGDCRVLVLAPFTGKLPPARIHEARLEGDETVESLLARTPELSRTSADEKLGIRVEILASGRECTECKWTRSVCGSGSRFHFYHILTRALPLPSHFVHAPLTEAPAAAPTFGLDAATVSARLGGLSAHEVDLFLFKSQFDEYRQKLARGALSQRDILAIQLRMRNMVETSTRHRFALDEGIVLDGPIRVATAQAATSLLFAIVGSSAQCAKVGPAGAIEREHAVYSAVHAGVAVPTVPKPSHAFRIPNNSSTMALVMPLYGLTVADAAQGMPPGRSASRSLLATNVALCCLASVEAFSRAGYAHGDIKPPNLMLDHSGVVSLIDLGTARPLGETFSESSKYSLAEPTVASVDYDLVCVGSTLAYIELTVTPEDYPTRDGLYAYLAGIRDPSPVTRLALQCLSREHVGSRDLLGLARALVGATVTRDLPGMLTVEAVWPTVR
jgi:hypothetical protein